MLALSQGSVDVADLARRYGVSTETIRRDLSDMQDRNLLRRVHGGAVPVERINHEPMLAARDVVNAGGEAADRDEGGRGGPGARLGDHRLRIDDPAPGRGVPGRARRARRDQLADDGAHAEPARAAELTVLGGAVRTNTLAMVDDTTRAELQHMAIDVLFISCDGLSFQHGLTTPYREEHTIKRAMIERARRVVAMVDHSKFGNVQMFSFAAFDEIDVLVTGHDADPEAAAALSNHGIAVHRV